MPNFDAFFTYCRYFKLKLKKNMANDEKKRQLVPKLDFFCLLH